MIGMRRCSGTALAVIAGVCALISLVPPAAGAAGPSGEFAPFAPCPYTDPEVQACLLASPTAGSFKLGKGRVELSPSTPISLQGAYAFLGNEGTAWYDAVGGPTLIPSRLTVAGGLVGSFTEGGTRPVLGSGFGAASPANNVYATAELAGPIGLDFLNYLLASDDPTLTLPIKIHVENPLLGPDCYLGSDADPIELQLTMGTTKPPAGIAPLTGSPGHP